MTDTTLVLASLAGRIAVEHAACASATRSALVHARACGVLLAEAKAALPHGAWTDWLAEHFAGAPRTAQAYMRVAARWPELEAKAQSSADLSLDGALRLLAAPVAEADGGPWQALREVCAVEVAFTRRLESMSLAEVVAFRHSPLALLDEIRLRAAAVERAMTAERAAGFSPGEYFGAVAKMAAARVRELEMPA